MFYHMLNIVHIRGVILHLISMQTSFLVIQNQKQPHRGVLRKRCSENTQQIYRRTPMPKCDFNKVALQIH